MYNLDVLIKMIPLIARLKKGSHRDVAQAQDLVVREMAEMLDTAVFHGGTAIWRCFKGNRFSEDIDVYLRKDTAKIEAFFKKLESLGFKIEKKKIGGNSIYSNLLLGRTEVRFEALFKSEKGSLKEYETADGNLITLYCLTAEELVNEKVDTYLKRMKVRDLYDIFFLLRHVEKQAEVIAKIKYLLSNYKKPVDEKELKVLILEGLVPSAEAMKEYIGVHLKRWEK
ncbi:MAG: nucleotidyl transferase AbiEii/AbiGii toxin family protein [Candidatus Nanoarchaeia archaeon]|nr:nucleotidyl transferase AbiEii/AbiGii toxin family protein [Candidatus Nanoarchaeia archaeon]